MKFLMMPIFMNKIYTIAALFLISSCTNKEELPKANFWKYSDGAYFGDALIFDENYVLKNDTIFLDDTPLYILEEHDNQWYIGRKQLILKDLKTGQLGYYIGK